MLRDYEPSNHFPVVSVFRPTAIRFVSLPLMQDLCLDDPTTVLVQVPALWLRLLGLRPNLILGSRSPLRQQVPAEESRRSEFPAFTLQYSARSCPSGCWLPAEYSLPAVDERRRPERAGSEHRFWDAIHLMPASDSDLWPHHAAHPLLR